MKTKNLFDDIANMKTLSKRYEVYEIKYIDKKYMCRMHTKVNGMTFVQFAKMKLETAKRVLTNRKKI